VEKIMSDKTFKYNDGTAYERGMAPWSRLVGDVFPDWLALSDGLGWVDVGCGNGAFTELIMQKCHPIAVEGIDPSEGQLEFARNRASAQLANFRQGDAMALPFPEDSFDAATKALVIFFVPDPAKGVAEMLRVVRPEATNSRAYSRSRKNDMATPPRAHLVAKRAALMGGNEFEFVARFRKNQ
jgi:ubiquinone/menaquinone biosynthesis C-methylase UbiE